MLTIRKEQMEAMTAACGRPIIMPCKRTWIEFQLLDEDGNPAPNTAYEIKLPDGSILDGALDQQGVARFDNLEAGQCQITFPEIDANEWCPV